MFFTHQVKKLYVRNIAPETTEDSLRELFSRLGGEVERVKKQNDYAFVHMKTREEAQELMTVYHSK